MDIGFITVQKQFLFNFCNIRRGDIIRPLHCHLFRVNTTDVHTHGGEAQPPLCTRNKAKAEVGYAKHYHHPGGPVGVCLHDLCRCEL